jgi:hypothetical protein
LIFYFPNRPTLRPVDPNNLQNPTSWYLDELEASGKYVAELKFNGDNVYIDTDKPNQFWNRHKQLHRYAPPPAMLEEIAKFPHGSLLNAELLNFKIKASDRDDVKDVVIVHCVMKWEGKLLIGKTWGDSRAILDGYASGKHVHISEIYKNNFWNLYQQADEKKIEGIILKDPSGKLMFSTSPIDDVPWMIKFRHACAKYHF